MQAPPNPPWALGRQVFPQLGLEQEEVHHGSQKIDILSMDEGTIDVHLCPVSSPFMLPPQLPVKGLHITPGGKHRAAQQYHHHTPGLSQAKLAS